MNDLDHICISGSPIISFSCCRVLPPKARFYGGLATNREARL